MLGSAATGSTRRIKTCSRALSPLGKKARYIPAGVLPFPKLEEKWCSNNVSYGVLVQKFLGVDNSYLVRQVREHPWLRRVIGATNADGTPDSDAVSPPLLEDMHRVGVRGVRLNLLKKSEEVMTRLNTAMNAETGDDGFVNLWAFIKEHDWRIEAQQESDGGADLIEPSSAPAAELSSTTSRGLTLPATWRTRAGELSYEQPETTTTST
ncbi:unnamed protein product [Ectocarpus sp. 12 AP-2014]